MCILITTEWMSWLLLDANRNWVSLVIDWCEKRNTAVRAIIVIYRTTNAEAASLFKLGGEVGLKLILYRVKSKVPSEGIKPQFAGCMTFVSAKVECLLGMHKRGYGTTANSGQHTS